MKERSELVERALAMLTPSRPTAAPSTDASTWRDLATVTGGLTKDDPRLTVVLTSLAECQRSHDIGDLDGFTKAAARVRRLMLFHQGSVVFWEGTVNHRLVKLGPSPIEFVHVSDGQLWVWTDWKGGRWISESIITTIEGPK